MSLKRSARMTWGGAIGFLHRTRRIDWIDLVLVAAFLGLIYGVVSMAHRWTGQLRPSVEIDLSPTALPKYTFFSLSRGLIAYIFSLCFTLVYGYWAAKDAVARRVLIPVLDILQSIPVLGFMPGLVLALVALFPHSNIGLELASVIMIFTGQVWNMTFSFYHSLRSVPQDEIEVAAVYRFSWWQKLTRVELPFSTMGLVWNSMMSMAGGWFFLMITEAFTLGSHDFRLPGLGSYMSVAVAKGDVPGMFLAVLAMIVMIIVLDQLLWRPIVAWAQKFRVEETGPGQSVSAWFLDWLSRSRVIAAAERLVDRVERFSARQAAPAADTPERTSSLSPNATRFLSRGLIMVAIGLMMLGAWRLVRLWAMETPQGWLEIAMSAGTTLSRVLASTALGTVWALPVGLAIGLSPRASKYLQPVVQILASFPAPMLFPAVIALLAWLNVSLGWGSIILMLLGTQWYILFNVVAGAMAIPADLQEAARSFHVLGIRRFWRIYSPAVFPYLVTGWVTAAGGAWNASIVAEIVTYKNHVIATTGLGARISQAAAAGNFPELAASILIMAAVVASFNRAVWQRLFRLAEGRFSLSS